MMNIPDASKMYEMCRSRQAESEKKILLKQQQIIEKAFADHTGESNDIIFVLDTKLIYSLAKQLRDKGYDLYQKMTALDDSPEKWTVMCTAMRPKLSEYVNTESGGNPYSIPLFYKLYI
jgi:hypothetical protein